MPAPKEVIAELTMQEGMIENLDTDDARVIINALNAAGYVVVPKEPTDTQVADALEWALGWMKQHGVDGLSPFKDYPPVADTTRGMYRAMVSPHEE